MVLATNPAGDQFRGIDPRVLGRVVGARAVVDARNVLDASTWREAGWSYRALGCAGAA